MKTYVWENERTTEHVEHMTKHLDTALQNVHDVGYNGVSLKHRAMSPGHCIFCIHYRIYIFLIEFVSSTITLNQNHTCGKSMFRSWRDYHIVRHRLLLVPTSFLYVNQNAEQGRSSRTFGI